NPNRFAARGGNCPVRQVPFNSLGQIIAVSPKRRSVAPTDESVPSGTLQSPVKLAGDALLVSGLPISQIDAVEPLLDQLSPVPASRSAQLLNYPRRRSRSAIYEPEFGLCPTANQMA